MLPEAGGGPNYAQNEGFPSCAAGAIPPAAQRHTKHKGAGAIMDFARARKAMVDSQVRPNDVPDVQLQKAMEAIPRERFVPANRRNGAYIEKDVPLFDGRWLLKARDFSKLVHGARIRPTDLVLDVGCGYGYSCAVIASLASVVVGLEESTETTAKAQSLCMDLRIDTVAFVDGPLAAGVPSQGPFDVIVIAAGVETGLDALLDQLNPSGGRLVTVMMKASLGTATLFERHGDTVSDRALFEAHPTGVLAPFATAPSFAF